MAPVLWNRIQELPQKDPGRALLERCRDFSAAAGLDAEAARQWSLAREVENALWYASRRGHEGDLARSLWVASTLAGRTLPGLPTPQELPAPGRSPAKQPERPAASPGPAPGTRAGRGLSTLPRPRSRSEGWKHAGTPCRAARRRT